LKLDVQPIAIKGHQKQEHIAQARSTLNEIGLWGLFKIRVTS